MKRTALAGSIIAMLSFAFPTYAQQVITAPYWCGSYWSSTPCSYNSYSGYGGYQNYYSGYPSGAYYYNYGYPNNNYSYSYPYQYQYGNPHQYYSYPAPTCTITFSYTNDPDYVGMYQAAIQLSWSSNNASSAYISGLGSVSQSGTRVVYPNGYGAYVMSVYGPGGENSCSTQYLQQQYYQPVPSNYWDQYSYNYGYNYGPQYAW